MMFNKILMISSIAAINAAMFGEAHGVRKKNLEERRWESLQEIVTNSCPCTPPWKNDDFASCVSVAVQDPLLGISDILRYRVAKKAEKSDCYELARELTKMARGLQTESAQSDSIDEPTFTTQVSFDESFRVLLFIICVHYAGELGALINMPSLVGEIFAGVILGPQVAAFVPFAQSLVLLGEIGLILLMFEAGIKVNIPLIRMSGSRAIAMSLICATLATSFGIGAGFALGVDFEGAFSIGTTFSQSAFSTSLSTLREHGLVAAPIGQMILVAATVDDMGALTLLSVMASFGPRGKNLSAIHYFLPIISSVSWLIVLGVVAITIAPQVLDGLVSPRMRRHKRCQHFLVHFLMIFVGVAYMLLLQHTKSSYLMGATLAGMTFSQCEVASEAFSKSQTVYSMLMKLFFAASVGFQIPVQLFGKGRVWLVASLFVCTAVASKSAAALFVPTFHNDDVTLDFHRRDRIVAALCMISRGGFGFMISSYAFNAKLIDGELYASVVLATLFATIFPSYLLNVVLIRHKDLKLKAQIDGLTMEELGVGLIESAQDANKNEIDCDRGSQMTSNDEWKASTAATDSTIMESIRIPVAHGNVSVKRRRSTFG